jgi:hypothetical protein
VQSVTWLSVYPCFEKYHTLTKYWKPIGCQCK